VGIHHVTAIASDPQRNLDFYAGTLGLRLVKLTVNFDDPGSYHLYYGDEIGRPGSLLTFFAWPGGQRGRQGTGQASVVSFAVPPASLGFWIERLLAHGVKYEGPTRRSDDQALALSDPDGLLLELVATPRILEVLAWADGPLPQEHTIRGLHGVTLWEDGDIGSADFLTGTMGFESGSDEGGLLRFQSGGTGVGSVVNLRRAPGFWRGSIGVGTVHHVAFRAASDEIQLKKRAEIAAQGREITPVIDRQYFHSVYFREPGGILFEIATDTPGFLIDESRVELGTHLRLPPMYEPNREQIERVLPPVRLPQVSVERGR
jgi:glyoxalase family protein